MGQDKKKVSRNYYYILLRKKQKWITLEICEADRSTTFICFMFWDYL